MTPLLDNNHKKKKEFKSLSSIVNSKSRVTKARKKTKTKQDGWVFSLAGVHGVGKTTVYEILKKKLSDNLDIKFFPERLRSIPPVPFGSKNKQIAFRSELHYQQQMIERNGLIGQFIRNQHNHVAILDRSPLSTLIYAKALGLPKIDYDLIYDTFISVPWQKEYVIYLYAEPKSIMNRIYHRGSLDIQRQKWNEDDFKYLLRVLNKYAEIFEEFDLKAKKKIVKLDTEHLTPYETVERVLEIIKYKSGIQLKNKFSPIRNQKKITSWISN
ncbi:MAG: deoxynucleoside kinase [Promethearchaeota archaeon]